MANKNQVEPQIEHRVYLVSPKQETIALAAWKCGMGNVFQQDNANVMFSIWNHVVGHETILNLLHNARS